MAADLLDCEQLGKLGRGVADDDDVREHASVADDLEDHVPRADVGHRARLVATRGAQVLVRVAAALDGVGHERGAGGERARAREEHDHGEAHREVGKVLGGRRTLGQGGEEGQIELPLRERRMGGGRGGVIFAQKLEGEGG